MKKYFLASCYIFFLLTLSPWAWGATLLDYKIEGLQNDPKDNAISRLKVEQKRAQQPLNEKSIQTLYNNGPAAIEQAIQPYGYFYPKITSHLSHKGDKWEATYHVVPGKAMKITQVDLVVTGPGKHYFNAFIKKFPLTKGETLSVKKYNQAKNQFYNIAVEDGFLAGKLTAHRLIIDEKNNQARVILHFETGPQYYFGNVTFSESPFKQSFLEKYIPFKCGDRYSGTQLMELQQNLTNSGYFSSVSVNPERGKGTNLRVPVDIKLIVVKKYQYSLGLGYGTDTGPRTSIGLNLRRLTSTGQNFRSLLTLSTVESTLQGRYIIPGRNPMTDQFYIAPSIGQENFPHDNDGIYQKISFGYITKIHGWQTNIFLTPQYESYTINDGDRQHTFLLLPGINISRSNYDNPIFPLKGGSINLKVRGAAKEALSDSTFLQTEAKGRYIFSITPDNRFVFRADVGYTWINELDQLPLSLQFFAGGAQSIRAYKYQDLGPGRFLYVGSAEYQRRVWRKLYLTAFYDAGNASNNFHCTSSDKSSGTNCGIKNSPGVGIMYASPVGPLQLNLAQAIDEKTKPYNLTFNIGVTL